jgi:hypothetical protein
MARKAKEPEAQADAASAGTAKRRRVVRKPPVKKLKVAEHPERDTTPSSIAEFFAPTKNAPVTCWHRACSQSIMCHVVE